MLVHNNDLIEMIKGCGTASEDQLKELASKHDDVYFTNAVYTSALLAAGTTVEMTKLVCDGKLKNGIAVVRPPGHHAEVDRPRGYCYFDTVAIAARDALKRDDVNRILIVDWDVHHGNGIQHFFYDDPSVLYCSLHRYDDHTFYPESTDANYDMVGNNKGAGYNMNFAWNWATMGDGDYLTAFHRVLMPVAYEFNPDLVLVACGLDAARGDPLGCYDVTPHGYAHMIHQLCGLAEGRMVVVLEGGYNLTSIAQSMVAICRVLLGHTPPRLKGGMIANDKALKCISSTAVALAPYWKCLRHNLNSNATPIEGGTATSEQPKPQGNTEQPHPQVDSGQLQASAEQPLPQESAEQPSSRKDDVTELLEQLELSGHTRVFAVQPLSTCPHLEEVQPLPPGGSLDAKQPCVTCGDSSENWICLVCYQVFCGRYVNKHMVDHTRETNHSMVLSFSDLSVWCYPCDSYVHNRVLFPAIDSAHISKFGRRATLSS
ncbi:histone deacetylase 6-like isoform X2 [Dysidea avara]